MRPDTHPNPHPNTQTDTQTDRPRTAAHVRALLALAGEVARNAVAEARWRRRREHGLHAQPARDIVST
jgi:hypothetical protein